MERFPMKSEGKVCQREREGKNKKKKRGWTQTAETVMASCRRRPDALTGQPTSTTDMSTTVCILFYFIALN